MDFFRILYCSIDEFNEIESEPGHCSLNLKSIYAFITGARCFSQEKTTWMKTV